MFSHRCPGSHWPSLAHGWPGQSTSSAPSSQSRCPLQTKLSAMQRSPSQRSSPLSHSGCGQLASSLRSAQSTTPSQRPTAGMQAPSAQVYWASLHSTGPQFSSSRPDAQSALPSQAATQRPSSAHGVRPSGHGQSPWQAGGAHPRGRSISWPVHAKMAQNALGLGHSTWTSQGPS